MELILDRDAISGERGGAMPVMQSITRIRGPFGIDGVELVVDADEPVARSSSSVASSRLSKSTIWTGLYEKYLCNGWPELVSYKLLIGRKGLPVI
jgi:hypothetical protein